MDPGTVVKVEADSFDDLPKEYQSLFLDALDRLSPQVDPNARYKFDLLSAATVEGKAHEARETRINRQGPRPAVPPLPEYFAKALAHTIKKQLRPNASSSIRNLAMSDLNTQFCKPCRRIFDGNGSFVYTVSWLEKGLYYSHWDRRMLERSARKCPMCQLSYRSLGTASSSNREKIPGCYDFVEFIRAKDVYGLRFSYYEMSIGSKGLLPHTTASNLITLEAIEATGPLTRPTEELYDASDNTTLSKDYTLMGEWLNICDTSHNCTKPALHAGQDLRFLPARLIDVSVRDDDPDGVRIVDSGELNCFPKYFTLSHCWGTSEVPMALQLTQQNITSLKQRISLNELPRTFKDMVSVSRSLHIQYVWIDSLCILQDDKGDWKAESAKMWQIYSNAYANIAATSSSNSSQGLFREARPTPTKPCIVDVREGHPLFPPGKYHCYNDAEWIHQIREAPLSRRAWVHQEWLLSTRTLHYASDQLFWECREMRASETFPTGIPARYHTELSKLSLGSTGDISKQKFLEIWSSIVGEYSSRDLSHLSDKLIAVSAVARILSREYPDAGTYVAGMWTSYIVDQLSWSAQTSSRRSTEYRAPSWSWASMDGPIEPNFNWRHISRKSRPQKSRSPVSVLGIDTVFQDDPFDSISASTLRIEAPLLKVHIVPEDEGPDEFSEPEPIRITVDPKSKMIYHSEQRDTPFVARKFLLSFNTWKPQNPFGTRGRLDDDRDISEQAELYFMPLLTFNLVDRRYGDEPPEIDEIIGLMLEPVGNEKGQFRRCGTCRVEQAALLLCELGNQVLDDAEYVERRIDAIGLDDIVHSKWSGRDLDFVPKRFDRYVINLV